MLVDVDAFCTVKSYGYVGIRPLKIGRRDFGYITAAKARETGNWLEGFYVMHIVTWRSIAK
jgi:hypothetical protein